MNNILIESGIAVIKKALLNMPNTPGVYQMIDQNNKILYVGKAKDLSKRIVNYTQTNNLCSRMKLAISQINRLEIITTKTEAQALILEANLIKSLKPKYNILLKDDKSMPYILLRQDHDFPTITKFRGARTIKGQYFGPFASPKIVDSTIEFLEKTFLLRNCSDSFFSNRKNACMQYQLKRCSAPCVKKITIEEYNQNIKQAIAFLKGRNIELQEELSLNMQKSSDLMEYEKAARYRDQLRALNYIQNKNQNLFNVENADVIAVVKEGDVACLQIFLFRNGQNYGNRCIFFENVLDEEIEQILTIFIVQFYQTEQAPDEIIISSSISDAHILSAALNIKITLPNKGDKLQAVDLALDNAKMALERRYSEKQHRIFMFSEIQKLFELAKPLESIEIYDNSHIMGSNAVGAVVVASSDGFCKNKYRKYNIQSTQVGDDYLMIKEVLTRRFTNSDKYPDLILIDGGPGHLSVANKVLSSLNINIDLVCIAKGEDRNAGKEFFYRVNKPAFTLDKSFPVMKFLQILRDEAHRFAISSYRKKHIKSMNFSILSQINGIGPKKRKILTNHFTSMEEISSSSIEQLMKLTGFNLKTAQAIYQFFRK
jgi:excinuclease ABC subunit C